VTFAYSLVFLDAAQPSTFESFQCQWKHVPRLTSYALLDCAHAGNEGYGLRATVKRCCRQLVQIEMAPPSSSSMRPQQLVDSLNVSVATGILLHQLLTTARQ
jgi:hypothetical protein